MRNGYLYVLTHIIISRIFTQERSTNISQSPNTTKDIVKQIMNERGNIIIKKALYVLALIFLGSCSSGENSSNDVSSEQAEEYVVNCSENFEPITYYSLDSNEYLINSEYNFTNKTNQVKGNASADFILLENDFGMVWINSSGLDYDEESIDEMSIALKTRGIVGNLSSLNKLKLMNGTGYTYHVYNDIGVFWMYYNIGGHSIEITLNDTLENIDVIHDYYSNMLCPFL